MNAKYARGEVLRKCCFTPKTFAESEVGCPLDHCECGTHDVSQEFHDCGTDGHFKRCPDCNDFHDPKSVSCEELAEIRQAEADAGWDPNP